MHARIHIAIAVLLSLTPVAMSRFPESQKVRKPAVAGSFYPASAKEIHSMIGPWIHPSGDRAPQALIVPHAGYVFSGEVAASAFNRIPRGHSYKRIFLLGPSHRVGFNAASVDTLYSFAETPLGRVPIDVATGRDLIDKGEGAFTFRADAHDREHCLEVQLPFLQTAFEEVPPIVPIVIGSQRLNVLQQMAEVLEPWFNEDNLFVISSDFSHYPSYEDAKKSALYTYQTEVVNESEFVSMTNLIISYDAAIGKEPLLAAVERDHIYHLTDPVQPKLEAM